MKGCWGVPQGAGGALSITWQDARRAPGINGVAGEEPDGAAALPPPSSPSGASILLKGSQSPLQLLQLERDLRFEECISRNHRVLYLLLRELCAELEKLLVRRVVSSRFHRVLECLFEVVATRDEFLRILGYLIADDREFVTEICDSCEGVRRLSPVQWYPRSVVGFGVFYTD